jgi:hypothetical protein
MKTIEKLLIFSTFIVLLIGCDSNKNNCDTCISSDSTLDITKVKERKFINFKKIMDFSIRLKVDDNMIYTQQVLNEDDHLVLIHYFQNNKLIYTDIDKRKNIKEVPFPDGTISNLYRLNKDSLFLLYRPELRKGNNNDSILLLMDEKGKTHTFFNYDDANVISPRNKNLQKDSVMYLHQSFYEPLVYENNKLFLTFIRQTNCGYCLGGKDFFKIRLPHVGYVDLQKNKFIGLPKITYPYLNESSYFSSGYDPIHIISLQNNKEVLISFEYTPLIYKYNYLTDSIIEIKGFKSAFKDSIYASSVKPETSIKVQGYSYYKIVYDKKNKRYIRYFSFPFKTHLSSLIFADSSLNVTAEGIEPKGYGFIASISKDTLLFYNYTKSLNSHDSLYFSLFTIDEEAGLTQTVVLDYKKMDCKTYDIKEYIKNTIKTDEDNFATVIIPIDISCPGCVMETLRFFSNNIKKISGIPVYLIISTEKEKRTVEMLHNNNLDNQPKTVHIDLSSAYYNYHPENKGFNPRLILVENNKVISDKIYDATIIRILQEDLIAFLMKHKYIKGST